MKVVRFAVGETPYCVWDPDPLKSNLSFLESLDPRYYEYLVQTHAPPLDDSETGRYAAAALRTAYSQALETLFALLASAVQAPDCVYGWLLKYRTPDLDLVVTRIANLSPLFTRFSEQPLSWKKLSTAIHPLPSSATVPAPVVQEGFADLWERLAGDFLDPGQRSEYNSLKHGARARLGGFSVTIRPESTSKAQASQPPGLHIPGSPYGSSYPYLLNMAGDPRNFTLGHSSRNWGPEYLCNALVLIAYSIGNVISFLKVANGAAPDTAIIRYPDDPSVFTALWTPEYQVLESKWAVNPSIRVPLLSPEQILSVYTEGNHHVDGA